MITIIVTKSKNLYMLKRIFLQIKSQNESLFITMKRTFTTSNIVTLIIFKKLKIIRSAPYFRLRHFSIITTH